MCAAQISQENIAPQHNRAASRRLIDAPKASLSFRAEDRYCHLRELEIKIEARRSGLGQSRRFRDVGVSAASPRSTDMNTAIRCVRRHQIGDITSVSARRFRAHGPV